MECSLRVELTQSNSHIEEPGKSAVDVLQETGIRYCME